MRDRCALPGRTMTSTGAMAAMASAASSATTQRFDRHVSNASCKLVEVNVHLLCALCSGYLVDATTIIECLHTFCRSCIVRYLESSETCPVCDVPLHQTNPLLGIRADTTLQTLVYKLVPGVFKDEVKRRSTVINNAQTDGKSSCIMERLLKDICDMTTGGTIYTADEQFSVCLQYAPSLATASSSSSASASDARYGKPCPKNSCPAIQQDLTECSYLLCPASVTVAHLKKLIRNKLELSTDLPLDLYHSSPDGSLDDVYTLADVAYITAWTSVKPLHFYYQVNAKSSRSSVQKMPPPSVSVESDCKRKVGQGSRTEKLPSGACLKRLVADNRQSVKTKASSFHKRMQKSVSNKAKSPTDKCLVLQIPNGSSRKTPSSAETSPTSGEAKESDVKSDMKDYSRRKRDCGSQEDKATKSSSDEPHGAESPRGLDSKETASTQTKAAERTSMELTESEVTDTDLSPKTSSRMAESNETSKLSPNSKTSGSAECSPSADSALSPSRPETVSQSAMTVDSFDSMSDVEGNAIDSASSPPPSKRMKMSDPNDRNLFAAINSMIVSNNDNVVSSSTSSQSSTDDCADNKTSVETQTTAQLISRSSKKGSKSSRGAKKDSVIIKPRPVKQGDSGGGARVVLPPSSSSGVTADTSCKSVSVAVDTTTTATQQGPSATLCVPICIGGDKTGGASNLILNLPQNVSVECRIRSDKILIASNPTVNSPDAAASTTTTFGSIAYDHSTAIVKSPAPPIAQSLTSETSPSVMSQTPPCVTSQTSPSLTSQASLTLTSHVSRTMTSKAMSASTSESTFAVKSPEITVSPDGSSVVWTAASSLAANDPRSVAVATNVKSSLLSGEVPTAKPLPRQLDASRTIGRSSGNVCKGGVNSASEFQASGKEAAARRGVAVQRTVDASDNSLRFRDKNGCSGSVGEVSVQSAIPGKCQTTGHATRLSPVRCVIPTRSPETVLRGSPSAQAKPQSKVTSAAAKTTCSKSPQEVAALAASLCRTPTDRVAKVRDMAPPNVAAAAFQQKPATADICKAISHPVEVAPPAAASITTSPTSSGVSTTKAVLFKPYQMTPTPPSRVTPPKRSADDLTAPATFQGSNAAPNLLYQNSLFPVFPNFPSYPKGQAPVNHPVDASKPDCGMTRESVVLASTASCGELTKSGVSAVHRTMSNIPLHSVIKVPTYTARKMPPQNRKSEKKGSRSPRNDSVPTPAGSASLLRKPEPCPSGRETALGQIATKSDEAKVDHPVSNCVHKAPVSVGSQSIDCEVVAVQVAAKGIEDDPSHGGKVGQVWNQPRTPSSVRSCLKLPLVSVDALEKGDSSSSSSSSISTSSNEQSAFPTCTSDAVPKTGLTKRRCDLPVPGPSGSGHRQSPKRPSEKTCPADEMSYTRAEADSGTSPGAVSLSPPPHCGSKTDEATHRGPSPNPLQSPSAAGSTSLRKKLVIDLERCSPRQKSSSSSSGGVQAASPSVSTSSLDQRPHCCSPSTTTVPPSDPPSLSSSSSGQSTPPRLIISLPRCQVPAATTLASPNPSPCLQSSQWSPSSSGGTDNNSSSPPTTKRLKLMCNGMTIYRTLESPGSRSPRRNSATGATSRRASPVSAPAVTDTAMPSLLLPTRAASSSCKSPSSSSSSPPQLQGKCRRKSSGSAPVLSTVPDRKGAVVVADGEPSSVVLVSVDSTSTSPRTPGTTNPPPPPSSDGALFTVVTPWKGHGGGAASVLPESAEEPLELTTREVKERQKEREYAKLMSNLRPPSAFTT